MRKIRLRRSEERFLKGSNELNSTYQTLNADYPNTPLQDTETVNHQEKQKSTRKPRQKSEKSPPSQATFGPEGSSIELEGPRISREQQKLIESFTELFQKVGIVIASVDMYDGLMIAKHAEKRATELVLVARHHPWLMELLNKFGGSNDYIELVLGYGIMAYALMAHHNQVPAHPILAQLGYGEIEIPNMEHAYASQEA